MEKLPLTVLRGVGPQTAAQLSAIGVHSVEDMLHYYPRSHEDYSHIAHIKSLKPGMVTIQATIKQATGRYVRRGMHITEAIASDATGSVRLIWFNQPYRATGLKAGQSYFITGKLELKSQRFAIQSPRTELVSEMPVHTARIVPIYRETKGVGSTMIRKIMAEALTHIDRLPEVLPESILVSNKLLSYSDSLKELHFPTSSESLQHAKQSLGFTEVFELMLASQLNKQFIAQEVSPSIPFDKEVITSFVEHLTFTLTNAQRIAAWQIFKDMQKTTPMNRLLEGDVGSGKTAVAALAALMAIHQDFQVALLAPTELLARQHAESLTELLKPLGYHKSLGLLVGSMKPAQKKHAQDAYQRGAIKLLVGTHALLQDKVKPLNLGLLIVDEQHRFGVEQRTTLLKLTGKMPHVLSMTATPIPRSLALTMYGELDISLLDELPPGRKPTITELVSPNSRVRMYEYIHKEIEKHHQVYVVCPVITKDTKVNAPSAEIMFERIKTEFKGVAVGLLHGKLKSDDKNSIMERFVTGKIKILVATTVIEVGVNVPNATVMIIEGADRFGLAQMHQLRGRVGRSSDQGYCFIVPSDSKAPSKRLRAMVQSNDGFKLAELDLELRGPGAIYGTLQSGALDLRFAQLHDSRLLASAREAVHEFLERYTLEQYPVLAARVRMAQAVITLN